MNKLNLFILGFLLMAGCAQGTRSVNSSQNGSSGSGENPNQVNITWASNLGEQEGFNIEESTDGTNFSQILVVPDGTNNAVIVMPGPGKYYFRVRGYNQAGNSPYTPVVTANI